MDSDSFILSLDIYILVTRSFRLFSGEYKHCSLWNRFPFKVGLKLIARLFYNFSDSCFIWSWSLSSLSEPDSESEPDDSYALTAVMFLGLTGLNTTFCMVSYFNLATLRPVLLSFFLRGEILKWKEPTLVEDSLQLSGDRPAAIGFTWSNYSS